MLTQGATRHFGHEFGRERHLHLSVRVEGVEEHYDLFGSEAPFHVQGEETAVLAADVARQALQLSPVMVPCRAVAF